MSLHLSHCIIISLILIAGLLGNLFIWQNTVLGLTFGFAYLFFFGLIIGVLFFNNKPAIFKLFYGLFFLISGISLLGTLIYYPYQLNNAVISVLILAPTLLFPFLRKKDLNFKLKQDFAPIQINPHLIRTSFLMAIFIFLTILNFYFLIKAGTTEAIRSPWKVVPPQFFLTYFGASIILLIFVLKNQKESLNLILVTLHTFLSISLVLFIYKLGYGFDPFIHQATEKVIASQGFILPKPFYYLGQYSLVVFLAKIFQTPIEWIDKLVLPLLMSLILPITVYFSFKSLISKIHAPSHFGAVVQRYKETKVSLLSLLLLILPFTIFINTTPQSLANFYLLIIIFLSLLVLNHEFPIFYLWFLGFTTLLIHPLAGIPSLIFISFLTLFIILKKENGAVKIFKKIILTGSFILGALIFPLFLTATSFFLKDFITISLKFPKNLDWPRLVWFNHYQPLYDLVYTYGKNVPLIFLSISLVGYFLVKKYLPNSLIYLLTSLALIINYILIKFFITFPHLIQYEQQVFPQRILEISFYFLTPFFLIALYKFFEKIEKSQWFLKFFFILFFGLLLTSSLYYSYPRDDGEDYHIDRGYSISSSDIKAVHAIASDAGAQDYIVLANQMVGAAAVREFGFKKYYDQNFYYSIPTGYPLYKYYLKMVYEAPSRATVNEAANLVNVKLVYFVINKYWTDSEKIIKKAKTTANEWFDIDNGKIFIFKYQL